MRPTRPMRPNSSNAIARSKHARHTTLQKPLSGMSTLQPLRRDLLVRVSFLQNPASSIQLSSCETVDLGEQGMDVVFNHATS